ncbi:phage holin [Psychrobacillus sp. FJAT-21963]|uniref:phage holin n=1 Tax=Psychrobacillus sp. FJAT-21963 TaxID=1712028 RepID=UPI0006F5BD4C|nr:phage holin [Psychrobacillus sp. FJAT-21963]KQL35909.1 holin [Psychrobacillus sp. FJAT-21963]
MSNNDKLAPFDKMMIIRSIILFIAWINQFLVMKGYSPLPFNDEELELGVTLLVTFLVSIWAWWKNNDVRYKARRNTQYLKDKGLK